MDGEVSEELGVDGFLNYFVAGRPFGFANEDLGGPSSFRQRVCLNEDVRLAFSAVNFPLRSGECCVERGHQQVAYSVFSEGIEGFGGAFNCVGPQPDDSLDVLERSWGESGTSIDEEFLIVVELSRWYGACRGRRSKRRLGDGPGIREGQARCDCRAVDEYFPPLLRWLESGWRSFRVLLNSEVTG